MEMSDYPVFLESLRDVAECFNPAPTLDRVAPLYFHHLQPFDVDVVREAFSMALQNCLFFPKIAELRERAKAIGRARFEAKRTQETQYKRLGYEAEDLASERSPAEAQASIADILAILVDGKSMEAVISPAPTARPRVLHPAFRESTTNDAVRKEALRRQIAQVQREEERTSASMAATEEASYVPEERC
jgi:hypothetical protein